jgi:hypothetical protein
MTNPMIPSTGSTSQPIFNAAGQALNFFSPATSAVNGAAAPVGFIADSISNMNIGFQVLEAAPQHMSTLAANDFFTANGLPTTFDALPPSATAAAVPVAAAAPAVAAFSTVAPAPASITPAVATTAPRTAPATAPAVATPPPGPHSATPVSLLTAAATLATPPAPGTRLRVPATGDAPIDQAMGVVNAIAGAQPTLPDPLNNRGPQPGTDPLSTVLNIALALAPPTPPLPATSTLAAPSAGLMRAVGVMQLLAGQPAPAVAATAAAASGVVPISATVTAPSTGDAGTAATSNAIAPPVLTPGPAPLQAAPAVPGQPGSVQLNNPLGGPPLWVMCPPGSGACLTTFDGPKALCYELNSFVCTRNVICPTQLPDVCGSTCFDGRVFDCVNGLIVAQ